MNNRRLTISLVVTVGAFLINMGMSFFLTPFVVKNIGSEAYGFVSLAQNFTNYIQIITVALNSMSGRFITIAYHRGDIKEASRFLTSTFYANIFMCFMLLLPAIWCVLKLDTIVNVTPEIVIDVKWLFAFMFLSFFIMLIYSAFANATYIANRKDLEAKRNIESHMIKVAILLVCYSFLKPKVAYVGVASMAAATYLLFSNIRYLHILTPDLKVSPKNYSFQKVKELVQSGIWNSFTSLSNSLSTGLDLLITNLFISATAMGTLSIAKQIPAVIQTLIGMIGGVFGPNYTIAYAKNDRIDLMHKIRQSMVVLGIISNLCLTALLVVGKSFFSLWMPSQDTNQLQVLSILTIAGFAVNGCVQCIFYIYVITNKVKVNAIVSFVSNIMTIAIVFVLLKTTDWGIYAVASVSTVITILRNILFSIPYAAHCINEPVWTFFKPVLLNLIALAVCSVMGLIIISKIMINNWFTLMLAAVVVVIISLIINSLIITTKKEKIMIINRLKRGRN